MKIVEVIRAVAIAAAIVGPQALSAQGGASQMAGMAQTSSPAVSECAQAQERANRTIDAANVRLESARQSNSPAAMRASMDDLQAALRQLRTELAPCAALDSAAGDNPHAGHVTPNTQQAPPAPSGTAVMSPRSTAPAPAAAANPMAGMDHSKMTPAKPAAQAPAPARAPNSNASSTPPAAGRLTMAFSSQPNPPKTGNNQFDVSVKSADGQPVNDAEVSVLLVMPAMPEMKMAEIRNEVVLKSAGGGKYTGTGQVMMAGRYDVTLTVKRNGKQVGQQKLTIVAM